MAKSVIFNEVKKGTKSPWILGGLIIVGGIVVFAIARNMGGGGSSVEYVQSGPSEALQAAQLQANTALMGQQYQAQAQIGLATIQAQAQATEVAAQLAAQKALYETQLAVADLTSGRELQAILSQNQSAASIQAMQIQSQQQMFNAQLQSDYNRDALAAEAMTAQASLNAQLQTNLASISAASVAEQTRALTAQNALNAQLQQNLAQISATSQTQQAQINADVLRSQSELQAGVYSQMFAAQSASEIARYNYEAYKVGVETSAQTQMAQLQANSANKQAKYGMIGSVIGGIASLFSDYRLKEDIEFVGFRDDGLSMYRYTYTGDDTPHIGVMAQEVENHYPLAVGNSGDYLTVDYTRLN